MVSEIGMDAFYDCSDLIRITLPNSIQRIGTSSFFGYSRLSVFHCKADVPPVFIGDEVFDMEELSAIFEKCVLAIPESSIAAYKDAEYWNRFKMIVPDDVILSQYKLDMYPGKTVTIKVENCDDMPITWSSGDTEIAVVDDNGKITALNVGERKIIAEYKEEKAECVIRVSMDGQSEKIDGL